jgi:hypothetical protein
VRVCGREREREEDAVSECRRGAQTAWERRKERWLLGRLAGLGLASNRVGSRDSSRGGPQEALGWATTGWGRAVSSSSGCHGKSRASEGRRHR